MSLGSRIAELRRKANLSQEQLANAIGVSRSTISMWETGKRTPDAESLKRMADIFGVSVDSIVRDPKVPIPEENLRGQEGEIWKTIRGTWRPAVTVKIPIVGVIRAGEPIYAQHNLEGWEDVPMTHVEESRLFFLRITDDSMEPLMREGDLVLVREQPDVENGSIAVVMVDVEDATIKRVYRSDGQLFLQPTNPNYPARVVQNKQARIIGKVIEVRRKLE